MVVLGLVLLTIGAHTFELLAKRLSVLSTIGIIQSIICVVLWNLGSVGWAVRGREHHDRMSSLFG